MKTQSYLSAVAISVILSASMSSCEIPTFWEEDATMDSTYVRVDLTQNNETRGLFQWYPEYELGVSFQQFENGAKVMATANQNYIIEDHIKSHDYDNERFAYYSGNWSDQLPLPTTDGEKFDYACYAPYTNANLRDFDDCQSALCPATGEHEGELFYRQGSDLGASYDFIWASINGVDKNNVSRYIETGPLYFKAEHALAQVCFKVEGLASRYELVSLTVRPSQENGALTQGYFNLYTGQWEATDAVICPEWSWSGIGLTRTETTASTDNYPLFLLPTYSGDSNVSSFDYELVLNGENGETILTGTCSAVLKQNSTHFISISK